MEDTTFVLRMADKKTTVRHHSLARPLPRKDPTAVHGYEVFCGSFIRGVAVQDGEVEIDELGGALAAWKLLCVLQPP